MLLPDEEEFQDEEGEDGPGPPLHCNPSIVSSFCLFLLFAPFPSGHVYLPNRAQLTLDTSY